MSGNSPAQIPRKLNRRWILIQLLNVGDKGVVKIKWRHALRWILIQLLNVGDKGVVKIKWRHALGTEALGMSHKKVDTYCYDLT